MTGQKAQKSGCYSCLCRTWFSVSLCHSPLPRLQVSAVRAPYTAHPPGAKYFPFEAHLSCTPIAHLQSQHLLDLECVASVSAWQGVRKCKLSDLQAWLFKQDLDVWSFHELNVTKQKLRVLFFFSVFLFVTQLTIATDAGTYPSNLNLV